MIAICYKWRQYTSCHSIIMNHTGFFFNFYSFFSTQIWRQLIRIKCWELLVTLENNNKNKEKKKILHSIFLKSNFNAFLKEKKTFFALICIFFFICVSSNTFFSIFFFFGQINVKEMLYRLLTCDCCCFLGTFLSSVSCACVCVCIVHECFTVSMDELFSHSSQIISNEWEAFKRYTMKIMNN